MNCGVGCLSVESIATSIEGRRPGEQLCQAWLGPAILLLLSQGGRPLCCQGVLQRLEYCTAETAYGDLSRCTRVEHVPIYDSHDLIAIEGRPYFRTSETLGPMNIT